MPNEQSASSELDRRCRALVEELGLGRADQVLSVTPLTGGVASDIARVELPNQSICIKFALAKLRVAADWQAPVHRNRAEYAWLKQASTVAPPSAITLLGQSETDFGFAMEFLDGQDVYLWKSAMLDSQPLRGEAAKVGDILGRVHAASTAPDFDTSPFENADDFFALRIEPYLTYTAAQHPSLAVAMLAMADVLYASRQVLVHGDVSPKNILVRDGQPIILDAECATMGDASFDVAFCLNHLLLKAFHLPADRSPLLRAVTEFWAAYRPHVQWEVPEELEARICRLLPMLMLARVDGKSPVEYLDAVGQATTRTMAIDLIQHPLATLNEFIASLSQALES